MNAEMGGWRIKIKVLQHIRLSVTGFNIKKQNKTMKDENKGRNQKTH